MTTATATTVEQERLDEEIDKELLAFLTLQDEFDAKSAGLQESVRRGHFWLAKSRYGGAAISPLSFDMATKATTLVRITTTAAAAADGDRFELVRVDSGGRRNPIHWYGLLPPISLRNAQRDFTAALDLAVDLADIRRRMMAHHARFKVLASQKKPL
jgi:hypothetical protein